MKTNGRETCRLFVGRTGFFCRASAFATQSKCPDRLIRRGYLDIQIRIVIIVFTVFFDKYFGHVFEILLYNRIFHKKHLPLNLK